MEPQQTLAQHPRRNPERARRVAYFKNTENVPCSHELD